MKPPVKSKRDLFEDYLKTINTDRITLWQVWEAAWNAANRETLDLLDDFGCATAGCYPDAQNPFDITRENLEIQFRETKSL